MNEVPPRPAPAKPVTQRQKSELIESLSGVIGGLSGAIRWLLSFLTYVYLLRFPLIAIAVVATFWVKKNDWAKMLAGAFDESLFDQTFALGLTNILFIYTISVVGHNVLGYSALRGTGHKLPVNKNHTNIWHHLWNLICALTAFMVPLTAWYYSQGSMKGSLFLWAIILGTVSGFVTTTLVHLLRRVVARQGHEIFDEKFPFMLLRKKWVNGIEGSKALSSLTEPVLDFFQHVKYNLTDGYLAVPLEKLEAKRPPCPTCRLVPPTPPVEAEQRRCPTCALVLPTAPVRPERRLLPGHGLALAMMLAFALVYLFVGSRHWGTAIVYILLLLTWLCWFLSGLAFFFDKYLIPTLVTLVLLFAALAWFPGSDHYFQLSAVPAGTDPGFSSEYVLAERHHAAERPIILVAANGGGIQSAAWTAKVLTGLTESFATKDQQQQFLESIRLISGVSGGSVGTMFFVNEIRSPDSGESMSFKNVVAEAEETGLEEDVWGLAYPDFWHTVAPWARRRQLLDRSHALEKAWIKTAEKHHSPPLKRSLLKWNRGVTQGWRPATIFNATLVESGERLQISTSPVRDRTRPSAAQQSVAPQQSVTPQQTVAPDVEHGAGRQELFDLFKASIRIATAARLSASFPYVSPAARPNGEAACFLAPKTAKKYAEMHVVDGGYFDNSGLCALTEWLQEGLKERENNRIKANQQPIANETILVIQIRGFPQTPETNQSQSAANAASFFMRRGWLFQLSAPISTMMGVMGSGQAATNDMEFYLLQKYWGEKHIDIRTVIFQPDPSVCKLPDNPIPLSWHLRKRDKDLIDKAWDCEGENVKIVTKFVLESQGH